MNLGYPPTIDQRNSSSHLFFQIYRRTIWSRHICNVSVMRRFACPKWHTRRTTKRHGTVMLLEPRALLCKMLLYRLLIIEGVQVLVLVIRYDENEVWFWRLAGDGSHASWQKQERLTWRYHDCRNTGETICLLNGMRLQSAPRRNFIMPSPGVLSHIELSNGESLIRYR